MKWRKMRNLAMLFELVNGAVYPEYVRGIVFGDCYVYDNRKTKDKRLRGWLVMHKPSGERIAVMPSKAEAKRMVRILHRNNRMRAALRACRRSDIIRKAPFALVKWIRKCSKRKKLLPR